MPISIIEFSIENFKIFKNKATFSMDTRKSEHTFLRNDQNLLKISLLYGANASGKSTLLDAFGLLRAGVTGSASHEGLRPSYFPFMLSNEENAPSFFEVIFCLDGRIFKYSFSILENKIFSENLTDVSSPDQEKNILSRREQTIDLHGDFSNSEDVKAKTRKEVLFLSAADQWNNELAMKIVGGFKDLNIISGLGSDWYRGYTMKLVNENPDMKKRILELLKNADFCIEDIIVEKVDIPEPIKKQMATNFKNIVNDVYTVFFPHPKFDSKKNKIGITKFNIDEESAGTQKFFNVLGPIVDTLDNGKVLLIDEFDNSLHPLLTKFILDLFEKNNPNNAQLIVTTHDTSLLSYKDLIKDQFWFTEKDKFGSASLFSLAEFDLRNDTEYSKKYLEGRFGALPFIGQN